MTVQEIASILPQRWVPILENFAFRLLNHNDLEHAQSDRAVYSVKFQLQFTSKENRQAELPATVVNWSTTDINTRTVLLAEVAEIEVSGSLSM